MEARCEVNVPAGFATFCMRCLFCIISCLVPAALRQCQLGEIVVILNFAYLDAHVLEIVEVCCAWLCHHAQCL